ncbi:uncharacterized protein LOC144581659 [Callithrix jacchus]
MMPVRKREWTHPPKKSSPCGDELRKLEKLNFKEQEEHMGSSQVYFSVDAGRELALGASAGKTKWRRFSKDVHPRKDVTGFVTASWLGQQISSDIEREALPSTVASGRSFRNVPEESIVTTGDDSSMYVIAPEDFPVGQNVEEEDTDMTTASQHYCEER